MTSGDRGIANHPLSPSQSEQMQVMVRLFTSFASYGPTGEPGATFAVQLPPRASALELVRKLGLPEGEVKTIFVNGRARGLEDALEDGDQVAIFPAIGGG